MIVTIFVNGSLKKRIVPNIITQPWNIDMKNQIRNVFMLSSLPFYKVAYNGGYFITVASLTSLSKTKLNTGIVV